MAERTQQVVVELPVTNELKFKSALCELRSGNAAEALRQAKELIDSGYSHAYTLAGAICERGGSNLEKNFEHSIFYYQKAVDEVGALEAWLSLGRIYFFGRGVSPDHQKALHYYSTVYDEIQSGIAAMMLARIYTEGNGVKRQPERAVGYLKKAIEEGYALASTQLAALEFNNGEYGKAAIHWLQGIWRVLRLPKGDPRRRPY